MQNNYNEMINGVINHNTAAEKKLCNLITEYAVRSVKHRLTNKSNVKAIAQAVTSNIFILLSKDSHEKLKGFLHQPKENLIKYISKAVSGNAQREINTFIGNTSTLSISDTNEEDPATSSLTYDIFNSSQTERKLAIVSALVNHLPEKQRLVIEATLYNFEHENLPENELAKAIGMTANQFARNKNAAIKKLHKLSRAYRNICELDDLSLFAA